MAEQESVPQMRERIEAQNTELSGLRKENQELTQNVRTLTAKEMFRNKGLTPTHAELFTSANPEGDITEESVDEFVTKFDLQPTPVSETSESEEAPAEETEAAPDPGEGLDAFSGGGSRSGSGGAATPGSKTMTKAEWRDLQASDPAAAKEALLQGRVELNPNNFYVKSGKYGN